MADSSATTDETKRPSAPTLKYMAKRVLAEFTRDGGTDQAAKLTYFMVLSIAPTLLALFSLATLLLSGIKDQLAALIKDAVAGSGVGAGDAIDSTLDSLLGSSTGGTVALIIGIGTALWSASAYVKAYGRVANHIYEVEEGRGPVRLNLGMLGITLMLILGILAIMVSILLNQSIVEGLLGPIAQPLGAEGLLAFLTNSFLPIWAWVKWPVILVLAFALVSVLYWGAPNVEKPFRLISPGGVFAIVGIALAAVAVSIYMTTIASYSSYGAIGGVMAILFALWVMNIVIIMGAEVDAEYQRARELETGMPAEESLTLPMRDDSGVKKAEEKREQLIDEGRDIRLRNLHRSGEAHVAPEHRLEPRADEDAMDADEAKDSDDADVTSDAEVSTDENAKD